MSVANGRPYLAIPGPSVIPDTVLQAMHRPSPNIYVGELEDMTHTLMPDLRAVARTQHHVAMYIANGHGAWEAALCNTLSRGDTVLVLSTGRFAHGWAEMARALGVQVEILECGLESDIDLGRVETALAADATGRFKAVLATHVDTSTGVVNDIAALRAMMDRVGHPALLMADCVASLGCDRFEMDAWGVDVAVAACQKGLMTPAGMGLVFFNDKADAARGDLVSWYWDWRNRANPDVFYQHFGGTAPTHHLYGLRAALDMIMAEGIEAVWQRHATLAQTIWAAFDRWSETGALRLNIADPAKRSHAITAVYAGAPDGDRLRAWCEQTCGLVLGIGLERVPESGYFRIGHMGHVNGHMIMGLLGTIEAGLTALEIPHGTGALQAAADVIATAGAPQQAQSAVPSQTPPSRGACCS